MFIQDRPRLDFRRKMTDFYHKLWFITALNHKLESTNQNRTVSDGIRTEKSDQNFRVPIRRPWGPWPKLRIPEWGIHWSSFNFFQKNCSVCWSLFGPKLSQLWYVFWNELRKTKSRFKWKVMVFVIYPRPSSFKVF